MAKRHVTAYSLFGEQHRHEPHALVCKAKTMDTAAATATAGFFPNWFLTAGFHCCTAPESTTATRHLLHHRCCNTGIEQHATLCFWSE